MSMKTLVIEDMNNVDKWVKKTGTGTIQLSSEAGRTFLRANGYVWYEYKENIPFDPKRLYRIRAQVRQAKDPSAGKQKAIWIGVAGIASDGNTYINVNGANRFSSQHYFAAASDVLPVGTWQEFTGYFKGHGTPAGGKHPDPEAPGTMYPDVSYIRPLFILNYPDGDGIADIDYVILEEEKAFPWAWVAGLAAAGTALYFIARKR